MDVIMLENIAGKGFSFGKGEKYKALDGDETGLEELEGKILVRQPDSPRENDWWCTFDKSCAGRQIMIAEGRGKWRD